MAERAPSELKVSSKVQRPQGKKLYDELMSFNINKDLDQLKW